MFDIFISIILFVIIIAFLKPKISKWYLQHHCPYCHSWFTVKRTGFEADTIVEGHDQTGIFGGLFKTLKIFGLFTGLSHTSDQPFLREFGKGQYICSKCEKYFFIEEHRDRR